FSLILLAGSALILALFGSGVAVAQARKGAETIQSSQDLSAAPLPGGSYSGDEPLGGVAWNVLAVGDFNGDGHPDLGLQNFFGTQTTGIWYMNINVVVGALVGPTLPAGWFVVGVGDFNGDGHPDLVLENFFGTQQTAIWYMNNNVFVGGLFGPTLPAGWEVAGVGDFNGDGHPDFLLRGGVGFQQTGIWYMNNNVFVG